MNLRLSFRDSSTMLRRNLLHIARYPAMTGMMIGMPVIMLLLFGYIFGEALGAGIGAARGSLSYINFLAPGIIVMTIAIGAISTATAVCTDMTEGIIARFRTMAIARTSILTGHVMGSMIQTIASVVCVIGVSLLMGFRPSAGAGEWVLAIALIIGLAFALTWLSVALGLISKTPEEASNIPMPIMFLPFLGSALIPSTSVPVGIRWFAEYQPFTPVIDCLRGLLMGSPISATSAGLAIFWCTVIALGGMLWSRSIFRRDPGR